MKARRYCDRCTRLATLIGSYSRLNGERCIVAVCGADHMRSLLAQPTYDQLDLVWREFNQEPTLAPAPVVPPAHKILLRPHYQDGSMSMADW